MTKKKGINQKLKSRYRELALEANKLHKEFMKEFGFISQAEKNILRANLPSAMRGSRTASKLKIRNASEIDYKVAIKELERFMQAKSATPQGYREIVNERINTVKENFDTSGLSDKDINDMLNFLGTSQGEQSKEIYDSNLVIQALIIGKINPENKKKSFSDIYKDVESTGYTIADYIRQEEAKKSEWIKMSNN